MKDKNRQKAQAAIELAVFGSILIFSLGIMINSSFNKSNKQNAIYTATRKAMQLSYLNSRTMEQASRNTASVLIIEDRLTAASAKYGAVNRTPLIFQGTGAHSSNMFMPVTFPGCPEDGDGPCDPEANKLEYTNHSDLPLFDLIVNGKHYSFTTAGFKTYLYNIILGTCITYPLEVPDHCESEVEPRCIGFETDILAIPCKNQQHFCDLGLCEECDSDSTEEFNPIGVGIPCPVFYKRVQRHPLNTTLTKGEWCTTDDNSDDPLIPECPPFNLGVDDRFDLDRDGFTDVPADPEFLRQNFAWQWVKVAGWQEKSDFIDNLYYRAAILVGELLDGFFDIGFKVGPLIGEGLDDERFKNVDIDVDGDLKPERIMKVNSIIGDVFNFVVVRLDVMDFQAGDLDYTYTGPREFRPGLLNDVNIYTFVSIDPTTGVSSGGTYLQIDEGKLFETDGDNRQFIRTASKKDSIDIIERVFRLSNDTGRFCLAGVPTPTFDFGLIEIINPVEACGECFSSANISKTCMGSIPHEDGIPRHYLYMRSAIKDLHGRKWVTDVSGDPHIDFE